MPFHKNYGAYSGSQPPKGGCQVSNSDILNHSKHRKMATAKKKKTN